MKTEEIDRKIGMPDVEREWSRFEREVIDGPRLVPQSPRHGMSRAAVVALVCVLGGLVWAATLYMRPSSAPRQAAVEAVDVAEASASVHEPLAMAEDLEACYDAQTEAFVFDDVEMQTIARCLGQAYGVEPVFVNDEARRVRFYVTIERRKSLDEIIELLNNFQHVELRHEGERLIIQ